MSESPAEQAAVRCQWCDTPSRPKAIECHACGAALPLLETVGEMVVPGVTHVDPELESYAKQPLRIPRGSPTQALAPGALHAAAILGGPAGVAALGALAAVAANELTQGRRGRRRVTANLGEPSTPVLEVARRLQHERAEGAGEAQPSAADDGRAEHRPPPEDAGGGGPAR